MIYFTQPVGYIFLDLLNMLLINHVFLITMQNIF